MSDPTFKMRSGIQALVASVDAYMRANSPGTVVAYGRRALTKQSNQGVDGGNRIVFAPPDDGKMGVITRNAKPGPFRTIPNPNDPDRPLAQVRAIGQRETLLLVSCWAIDPTAKDDELAQFAAVEELHEIAMRAVNAATTPAGDPLGAANVVWGKVAMVVTPVERINGAEGRYELTVKLPIYDAPEVLVYPAAEPIAKEFSTSTMSP